MLVLARLGSPLLALALTALLWPALAAPAGERGTGTGAGAGFLGVSVQPLTPALGEALDLQDQSGVLVNQVIEDSPAEHAGIEVGDVLILLNGKQLTDPSTLMRLVAESDPGSRAEVVLIRKGKKRSVEVEVGARRMEKKPAASVRIGGGGSGYLGIHLHDPDPDLAPYFKVPEGGGALILSVDDESPAMKAGLRAGDVVVAVDGEETGTSEALMGAIREKRAGEEVKVRFVRRGEERVLPVRLAERPLPGWVERPWGAVQRFRDRSRSELDAEIRMQLKQLEAEMERLKEEIEQLKER